MISSLSRILWHYDGLLKFYLALMLGAILTISITISLNAQEVAGTDYSDWADVDNIFDMAGQDVFGQ